MYIHIAVPRMISSCSFNPNMPQHRVVASQISWLLSRNRLRCKSTLRADQIAIEIKKFSTYLLSYLHEALYPVKDYRYKAPCQVVDVNIFLWTAELYVASILAQPSLVHPWIYVMLHQTHVVKTQP